jgi:peflin
MAGRDSLPHFPGRQEYEAAQKPSSPPSQKQQLPQQPPPQRPSENLQRPPSEKMYQPNYQQQPGPGGYPNPQPPVGGYQVGPPPPVVGGYAPGPGPAPQTYQQPRQSFSQPAPPGVDPQMWAAFKAADTGGNGQLSEKELKLALVNSDWTPFDAKTVKLMVKMFDVHQYCLSL